MNAGIKNSSLDTILKIVYPGSISLSRLIILNIKLVMYKNGVEKYQDSLFSVKANI